MTVVNQLKCHVDDLTPTTSCGEEYILGRPGNYNSSADSNHGQSVNTKTMLIQNRMVGIIFRSTPMRRTVTQRILDL